MTEPLSNGTSPVGAFTMPFSRLESPLLVLLVATAMLPAVATAAPPVCIVRGVVQDSTGAPIEGAEVILATPVENSGSISTIYTKDAITGPTGEFSMSGGREGPLNLGARKTGFDYDLRTFRCVLGEITDIALVLEEGRPFHVNYPEFHGKVGCQVGLVATALSTVDLCGKEVPEAFPDASTVLRLVPEASDITGMVVDLEWTPILPAPPGCFNVVLPTRTFSGYDPAEYRAGEGDYARDHGFYADVVGASPVQVGADAPWSAPLHKFAPIGFPFEFVVRGGNVPLEADPCLSVAADQPFTLRVTIYYNGDHVPQTFPGAA